MQGSEFVLNVSNQITANVSSIGNRIAMLAVGYTSDTKQDNVLR